MYPHAHFIAGILVGTIGFRLGFIEFYDIFIIGAISVLIDLDHYIHHIVHYGEWHPVKFWNHTAMASAGRGKPLHERTFIHHKNGFIVISIIIAIVTLINFRVGFIKAAAYYSHMILDHLKYFHIKSGKFKMIEFHGLKLVYSLQEEVIFAAMVIASTVLIVIF